MSRVQRAAAEKDNRMVTASKRKLLSVDDFKQHPVWVWDDENESLLPLSEPIPSIYEYGTLFIKSIFKKSNNRKLDGYLIGTSSFYAFGLFILGREFVMNLTLPSLVEKNMKEIYDLLGVDSFEFFPLYFESPISLKEVNRISGRFELKGGKLLCVLNYGN